MLWSDRLNRLSGYTMILLAVLLMLGIAAGFAITDQDPAERSEVKGFLIDVEDSQGLAIISGTFFILIDAVVGLVLTALLYLLFRDRSRFLALVVLVAFVANGATSMVADAVNLSMVGVADSYVNGGIGLDAGAPELLDITYALALISGLAGLMSFTALGIAMLALGLIIQGAPEGRVNPPRVLGWAAMLAALASFLSWTIVVDDIGSLFFAIQGVASLVVLLGVGGYLVMNPDEESSPQPSATG